MCLQSLAYLHAGNAGKPTDRQTDRRQTEKEREREEREREREREFRNERKWG